MPEIIPNLHPLLVHFPIVLIFISASFHIAALTTRSTPFYNKNYAILAHATLWLAALAALPTVFFGWQAFNSVNHDEASHAAMLIHRSWAIGSLIVLSISAGWDVWRNKVDARPVWWFVVVVIGACGLVTATAWHGGELVYRHGLGVMALPDSEIGHDHLHMYDVDAHASIDAISADEAHEHAHHDHTH